MHIQAFHTNVCPIGHYIILYFITKMASQQQHFRKCAPPCPHYITDKDTRDFCVCCLGALERADCEPLPLKILTVEIRLKIWLVLVSESGQLCAPHGEVPAAAEAAR